MEKNEKMEELRDELNKMIDKGMDSKLVIKLSQELDIYIVEAMKKEDNK